MKTLFHLNFRSTIILIVLFTSIQACPIYLTISLNGKTVENSFVEINWGPACPERPEWIGLFSEDPSVSPAQPLAKVSDLRSSSGKFQTKVQIGELHFPGGWNRNDRDKNRLLVEYPRGHCLPFYAVSFNGEEILSVECLKIHPNWMQKLNHVSSLPLRDLFIPGSHASGAFSSESTLTKSMLIKEYGLAQHFDVWSQLVLGIRFLDLSIGYQNTDYRDPSDADNFWIVNENMFIRRLTPILKDVKRFVELSQEVVILDFSSFPIGFHEQSERHNDFQNIINDEIGEFAYQQETNSNGSCFDLSVDDIRRTGKNLLILYPIQELPYQANETNIFCSRWKSFTTSSMNTMEALDFMRILFTKRDSSPIRDEGWIFHAVKGLEQSLNSNQKLQTIKERARMMNSKISIWLGGPWSLTANVVALDYFSNTNIVEIAIYANLHKSFTVANKNLTHFEIDVQHPMEISSI